MATSRLDKGDQDVSNREDCRARSLRADQFLISRTSLSGVVTYANQAFADAIGIPAGEVVGMEYSQLFDPQTPALAVRDVRETTAARGLRWHGVTRLRRPDGESLWAQPHVSPVIENGQVVRFTSVRTRAEPEEIAFVERMYERIRRDGWTIRNGRFIGPGPIGFLRSHLGWGMKGSLTAAQLPSLLCLIVIALLSASPTASRIGWLTWSTTALAVASTLAANAWFLRRSLSR
jgi:aerotaxis receptor